MEIVEIFDSIQGEGPFIGTPVTFVRLSGCNIQCSWCDTPNKDEINLSLNPEELIEKLKSKKHIVFTGGEPCLQWKEIREYYLRSSPHQLIGIETNGTVDIPISFADYVIVSPKIDVIGYDGANDVIEFWKKMPYGLTYFKFVVDDAMEMDMVSCLAAHHDLNTVYLQPRWPITPGIPHILENLSLFTKKDISVYVLPQAHKCLGLR